MAKLPPDPPWPWIMHEPGRFSTSPLEATFPYGQHLAQEPGSPSVKRQRLDTTYNYRSPSKTSSNGEKFPGLPRQCTRHPTPPKSRNEILSRVSGYGIGATNMNGRKDDLFPSRPRAVSLKNDQMYSSEKNVSTTVQASPSDIAIEASVPQYSKDAAADSYFWACNQLEDVLNEHSTKNGFYDRSTPSTSDLNTARPTVWSCLKHRSGSQVLSSLFVTTLCQRQNHGTIPSSGTFKPPPRVTLTDTKREAWLRDLADPVVPLRRLSRTIPHGIRGKALLDHCLFKKVPSWRAVWLAKCVGANEVRASKRKGSSSAVTTGGETRWIEEWTQNIEQFLESIFNDCGTQDWRVRTIHALQLVTHFYSEQLLDQRHFTDWITTSFRKCRVDRIPVWLLLVQLHWKEIWRFRCCGKQLAEAILQHVHDISDFAKAVDFSPLLQGLTALLRKSIVAFPDSYVALACWENYGFVLENYGSSVHNPDSPVLKQLVHRNKILTRSANNTIRTPKDISRQRLISALDGFTGSFDINIISKLCRDTVQDSTILVITILEWSSTPFRLNTNRLYLGVRLLRLWKDEGVEIDQPILDLIAADPIPPSLQARSVCRIIVELIRSRHFSTSRYLQWLLAWEPFLYTHSNDRTVLYSKGQSYDPDFPQLDALPFLLLRQLPLQGLPNHTLSLRKSLLDRHGYSVCDEANRAAMIREILARILPNVGASTSGPVPPDDDALERVNMDNRSLIAVASHFIRNTIAARRRYHSTVPDTYLQVLSPAEFSFTRRFFEKHEDFSVFADVMKLVARSSDSTLLQDMTSALNWHLEVFQAIGAAEAIFWDLFARAKDIATYEATDLAFFRTLAVLSERIHSPPPVRRFLSREIQLRTLAPPIVACSPVADPVVEMLEGSDAEVLGEIELVLDSGNSMDKQALKRLFLVITTRVEKGWTDSLLPLGTLFDFLCRLRQFDAEILDKLLMEWLKAIAVTRLLPDLPRILIPLVCSTTITLSCVMEIMAGCLDTLDTTPHYYELGYQLLSLLKLDSERCYIADNGEARSDLQMCRWTAEKTQLLRTESDSMPLLVQTILDQKAHLQAHSICRACALISDPSFDWLLHMMIIYQPRVREELEKYLASSTDHDSLDLLMNRLLGLSVCPQNGAPSRAPTTPINPAHPKVTFLGIEHRITCLLDTVDDFNIAFSRVNLVILLRELKNQTHDGSYGRVMTMLLSATVSVGHAKYDLLLDLISVLGSEHALEVHTRASVMLFTSLSALIPRACHTDLKSGESLEKLLSIIDITETSIHENEPTTIVKKVCDAVVAVRTTLQHKNTNTSGLCSSTSAQWTMSAEFHSCINILLRLIVIHQSRLRIPPISVTLVSQLVIDLVIILVHPALHNQPILFSSLFDHIALLSDKLTLESRGVCLHVLRNQHTIQDNRVEYLLGCPGDISSDSLRLSSTTLRSRDQVKHIVPWVFTGSDSHTAHFILRRWEMVQDATPNASENDTSLNLSLFGARKALI